jgi:hypothetical protein
MKLLAFLLAFVTPHAQQDPAPATDPNLAQYQNLRLLIKFSYPKVWELTTNKKAESRFLIPIENTSDKAVVEILPVSFTSEKNVWQLSQVGINKTLKREIERQWEEEILGVPLLLTKVNFNDKGTLRTSVTGLVYSLGYHKMMYRITASPSEFDKADYAWRQVLLTLRTWYGEMPTVEDGSKPAVKDPKAPPKGPPQDDILHPQIPQQINKAPVVKVVKAPVANTIDLSGKKVEIHAPSDWKLELGKDGAFTLSNPGVSGPITGTFFVAAAADPASIALFRVSAADLNDFVTVVRRTESLPKPNRAGVTVAQIWREGKTASGNLFTCEAAVVTMDYYLILTHRTTDPARAVGEQRLIQALLDQMSIELAP